MPLAIARGAVPHGGLDGGVPWAGGHVAVAGERPEALRAGPLADAGLLLRPPGVPLRAACPQIVAGRPFHGPLRPGRDDGGGLFVVLAEHPQDGRRRGVLAFLLASGDDKPGGDVAQAHLLAAQMEGDGDYRVVGDGRAADRLAPGPGRLMALQGAVADVPRSIPDSAARTVNATPDGSCEP